jgi:DNA-binding SARP family transcriptional activator
MGIQLDVRVLGGLQLAVGGRPLDGLASAKGRALLVYLAVTAAAQSRSALAGLLWSDLPEETARTNLRLVLTKLRRALPQHLHVTRQSVGLAAGYPVWVDALEVARLASAADDPDALLAGVDLCRGEFLAGVDVPGAPLFDEWVVAERAACRTAVLGVLDRAMQVTRDRADTATGIDVARRMLDLEPLHQEAHRALMWFLAHGGQPSAALAQYERCRSVLAEELGVEPSPATVALREEILRAGSSLGVSNLPIPRELPRPASDFTGRDAEQTSLLGVLADDSPPEVICAIHGMGGVGKSALAAMVANQLADQFPDGQLYLNLHGATLGLSPLDPLPALGQLLRALGLDPAQVPTEVEEAAARFRSLAADRRLLCCWTTPATPNRFARCCRPAAPAGCSSPVARRSPRWKASARCTWTSFRASGPWSCSAASPGRSALTRIHEPPLRWSSCAGACRWPSGSPVPDWPRAPAGRCGCWLNGSPTPPVAWTSSPPASRHSRRVSRSRWTSCVRVRIRSIRRPRPGSDHSACPTGRI